MNIIEIKKQLGIDELLLSPNEDNVNQLTYSYDDETVEVRMDRSVLDVIKKDFKTSNLTLSKETTEGLIIFTISIEEEL